MVQSVLGDDDGDESGRGSTASVSGKAALSTTMRSDVQGMPP